MGTRAHTSALAWVPACAPAVVVAGVLGGCVSPVHQEVVYGVAHPAEGAHAAVVSERRATEDGDRSECRDVIVTAPMERDALTRRTFTRPEAQQTNLAAFTLTAGGLAFLFYASDQANCPDNGGGCGAMLASQVGMAAIAAVPLGYLLYNALRARDTAHVIPAEPEKKEGPWGPCPETGSTAEPASRAPEPGP